MKAHPVLNVVRLIITTNNKIFGVYFTAEDRRHYVAWSDLTLEEIPEGYFQTLYDWYQDDGTGVMGAAHVVAYLKSLDISGFDPKAPPTSFPISSTSSLSPSPSGQPLSRSRSY